MATKGGNGNVTGTGNAARRDLGIIAETQDSSLAVSLQHSHERSNYMARQINVDGGGSGGAKNHENTMSAQLDHHCRKITQSHK